MIRSFADATTQDIWDGTNSKAARRIPRAIWAVAQRKLDMINRATSVDQLRLPPSSRLHPLEGKRKGQHAIAVNKQHRVAFQFENGEAFEVEVTDYHDE